MDVIELNRYGYPLLKRKEEISEKMKTPEMYFPIELMGKQTKLKCVSVRIEMPVYRLANGRTRSLQLEYLSLNPEEPRDLFVKDHDAFVAQFAQHGLLKQLVKEEDLLDAFRSGEREQTEPIICTDTGVVINGNRRLCAWRELYYNDKIKFKSFETISIAILEGCDEKAISDIEKRLQIQKTMRAEYHWHTKALMAKEDLERGNKEGEVAKSYDLTIKQLHTLIDAREFAAQYLISKGYENQWSRVDKTYYAFESIVTGRRKIANQNERELFERLASDLISENRDEVVDKPSGRLYTTIKEYADNIHTLATQLYEKYTPETPQPQSSKSGFITASDKAESAEPTSTNTPENKPITDSVPLGNTTPSQIRESEFLSSADVDDLDLLAGGEPVEVDKASIVSSVIDSEEDTSDIHTTIKTIIDTQKELQNEKDRGAFLLHILSKISGELQLAISNGLIEKVNLDGVSKQLDIINEKVRYIKNWVDGRK